MFGINEDVFTPKPLDDLLPTNDITISFREQDEQLHRDSFEPQRSPVAAKLKARAIQLEFVKLVRRGTQNGL